MNNSTSQNTPTSPVHEAAVELRRWLQSDAEWYVRSSRDEAIQQFTSDPSNLTAADVAAAIRDSDARADRDAFLICTVNGQRRLGNLAVEYRGEAAEVSYWVAKDARGHGVATRALQLLLAMLRNQGRVSAAELWTHADNIASRRAAERAGFVRDPAADCQRTIKGSRWPTVTYRQVL
jgi:[ribosomal protein S5]-alanine N-acetyltransferase